ncbi:MAG: hypothetical protein AAF739_06045 [Pseudomonadota bacterium]
MMRPTTANSALTALLTTTLVLGLPTTSVPAQTLDVFTLTGDVDVTITVDSATNEQILTSSGNEIIRAPVIVRDAPILQVDSGTAGHVLYVDQGEEGCAASPYVLTVSFGEPWLQGPIGLPCTPYAAATYPGGAILFSPPELHADGDAVMFDLEAGPIRLGPIVYAPQPGRGWDALDAEVGGYSDLAALDLYAAEPVYADLNEQWGDGLFVFAQHLRTRSLPQIEGNFLIQTGCLPSQCSFAIGLIAVDPANEQVYSAFFNEGAPDARPAIEQWSDDARAIYDTWREGGFR